MKLLTGADQLPEGKMGLPRANPKGKAEIPVVTRECRRNSRKTTCTIYDGELREPLVQRQRSQASMRVARQIASFLSSHGRD